jgi:hypothetical protein
MCNWGELPHEKMAPPGGFHPMFMLFEHTENCLVVTGTMEF